MTDFVALEKACKKKIPKQAIREIRALIDAPRRGSQHGYAFFSALEFLLEREDEIDKALKAEPK